MKAKVPEIVLHSNDVSLLSCGLGALATGESFPLTFANRLAFVEGRLKNGGFQRRMAAVLVAVEMHIGKRS